MKEKKEIMKKIMIFVIGRATYDLMRNGIKILLEYID